MATASLPLPEIYWRLNPNGAVDIISDGTILETTTTREAASRLRFHQNAQALAAREAGVLDAPKPLYWRADGSPVYRQPRRRR